MAGPARTFGQQALPNAGPVPPITTGLVFGTVGPTLGDYVGSIPCTFSGSDGGFSLTSNVTIPALDTSTTTVVCRFTARHPGTWAASLTIFDLLSYWVSNSDRWEGLCVTTQAATNSRLWESNNGSSSSSNTVALVNNTDYIMAISQNGNTINLTLLTGPSTDTVWSHSHTFRADSRKWLQAGFNPGATTSITVKWLYGYNVAMSGGAIAPFWGFAP